MSETISWYAAPHDAISSSMGMRDNPNGVREYSTHGGLSLTTVLLRSPSDSSSFRDMLSMRGLESLISTFLRSLYLMESFVDSIQIIPDLCFPPMSLITVSRGGSFSGMGDIMVKGKWGQETP